jgi:hypothetical protein
MHLREQRNAFQSVVESRKIAVFWEMTQCIPVNIYRCFEGKCCLHLQYSDWKPHVASKLLNLEYTASHLKSAVTFIATTLRISNETLLFQIGIWK